MKKTVMKGKVTSSGAKKFLPAHTAKSMGGPNKSGILMGSVAKAKKGPMSKSGC